jgi:cytochrome c peroxidase
MELFLGDAGCVRCHQGPLLSDGEFYRLGVSFQDKGLAGVTDKKEDTGKFRTPSLRNIAQTGPYMHNGSMKTLDEVVTFYYRGVPTTTPDGLALDIHPLSGQSFSEISDLVVFLESLSGEPPKITPPDLP